MRLALFLIPTVLLTGCLGGRDLSGCTTAERGDPTSRCYCFSGADRDRIRPYDDNAPPAWEVDGAASGGRDSLYDGSTVQPRGAGAGPSSGPTVIPR